MGCDHSKTCLHENVKYCNECDNVFCEQCGQTWQSADIKELVALLSGGKFDFGDMGSLLPLITKFLPKLLAL